MSGEQVRTFRTRHEADMYRAGLLGRDMETRYHQPRGVHFLWKPPVETAVHYDSTVLCMDGKWRKFSTAIWPGDQTDLL